MPQRPPPRPAAVNGGGLRPLVVLSHDCGPLRAQAGSAGLPGPGTYAEEGNETVGVRSARSFNKLVQTGNTCI